MNHDIEHLTKAELTDIIANDRTDIPKLLSHISQQEAVIREYQSTIRNMDALADSIRFSEPEKKPQTGQVVDEIIRLISELEKKVGNIT